MIDELSIKFAYKIIQINTLCDDRFWISMSPFELNRKTLKARCNLIWPSSLTRWQSRLEHWPIARSKSSTRMQFSANAVSCKFFASSWFAAAILDAHRGFAILFFKYTNEFRIKLFPNILNNVRSHRLDVINYWIADEMPLNLIQMQNKINLRSIQLISWILAQVLDKIIKKLSVCAHVYVFVFVMIFVFEA